MDKNPCIFGPAELKKLDEISRSTHTHVPEHFLSQSEAFLSELLKWNKKINLISRRDESRLIEHHLLDSLCLLSVQGNLSGKRIVDVGSGAGFPGVVLAAWEPKAQVFLVESRSKKVAFLRAVGRRLTIQNLSVVHSRIEALGEDEISAEPIDIVVSRGVGGILELAGTVACMMKVGALLVLYKGVAIVDELTNGSYQAKAERLGFDLTSVTPAWQKRTALVVLTKISSKS